MVTKPEFTKIMERWLKKYLENKYANHYDISVVIPESNLSKLAIHELKSYPGYSALEFKPDILGILVHKKTKTVELVLMNRGINAISLKEIGEIYCYSKLANPMESFIVSSSGLPSEVNLLLFNKNTEKKVLYYRENKFIRIFRYDVEKNSVDLKSMFPIDERD